MKSMAIARSRLNARGQIAIPAVIHRKLGIGPGSIVEWYEEGENIVVRRVGRFTSTDLHAAVLPSPPKRRKLGELKAGLKAHAKRRHARR